jgi:hypothetical protein
VEERDKNVCVALQDLYYRNYFTQYSIAVAGGWAAGSSCDSNEKYDLN